jgi:transposase InsO family protein
MVNQRKKVMRDNDKQFTSKTFRHFLKHNNIDDEPIPKSYSQLQGKVEAYNKIVKNEFLAVEDISNIKCIKPGIKTRSNSKVKSTTNCHARNMSVIRQQTNLKRWKRSVSYGHRWIAETVFSSIKRTFGEHVTARKYPHMVKEILLKATLYNMFNRIT